MENVTGGEQTWPFVTLPDMAVRASKLRSLSKIFLFSVYHYIAHEDRAAWESYAAQNKGWIDEGIETQKADPTFRGNIVEDWYSSDEINHYGERAADADFYIVRWQCAPVLVRICVCLLCEDHDDDDVDEALLFHSHGILYLHAQIQHRPSGTRTAGTQCKNR
jgi:hypothetical protein